MKSGIHLNPACVCVTILIPFHARKKIRATALLKRELACEGLPNEKLLQNRCDYGTRKKIRGSEKLNRESARARSALELMIGLEPTTYALPRRCATDCATSAPTIFIIHHCQLIVKQLQIYFIILILFQA